MLKRYLDDAACTLWNDLFSSTCRVVVTGHLGPDGDAMGSSLALAFWLKSCGCQVSVVMPNLYPGFLSWLPGADEVINAQMDSSRAATLISQADVVLCADYGCYGRNESLDAMIANSQAEIVVIDHHLNPDIQARLLISDPSACATAEIVYALLEQLSDSSHPISYDMSVCIYCGMMTDTGGFTYNSSRPEIFYIISRLLEKGIDKDRIYRNVYYNNTVERMRLMGYILNNNMVYLPEYHTAYYTLNSQEMKKYLFKKGDAEGWVNLPLEIKDTRLSISLREDTDTHSIHLSLRSVDDFPCNRMAAEFFNGGGHLNAAGGTLYCSMEEAVIKVREAIAAYESLLTSTHVTGDGKENNR